eukprot:7000863-Pyramimonas_sp.AAC.2
MVEYGDELSHLFVGPLIDAISAEEVVLLGHAHQRDLEIGLVRPAIGRPRGDRPDDALRGQQRLPRRCHARVAAPPWRPAVVVAHVEASLGTKEL